MVLVREIMIIYLQQTFNLTIFFFGLLILLSLKFKNTVPKYF